MLELKHIKKTYHVGDTETKALDDISLSFRQKEFVAILGVSGSGKTTCLNVIGGLDRYDSGDLVINGKHTVDFKDRDWDAYRNNSIGFIFQSYNLITHLGIVENVELGMTLSGVSRDEKHRRAVEALTKVGLEDHIHKKPNQLSGGQMQRVAIARALANDPDIILADEPTGALDTTTSVQIMDLIKEVAKDKLVIMVTHNPELAEDYADRIVRFADGKVVSDTNPYEEEKQDDHFNLKKTSMNFFTALRLSFNNIRTKKGRTALTAFASSIGIIGIALILSLSSGFQIQIDKFQRESLTNFPIIISKQSASVNPEQMIAQSKKYKDYPKAKTAIPYDPQNDSMMHTNVFSEDYMEYIKKIDPQTVGSIGYTRVVGMNLLSKQDDAITAVDSKALNFSSYPTSLKAKGQTDKSYLQQNFDLLQGAYPKDKQDLILVVDKKNRISTQLLEALGLDKDSQSIDFNELIGKELKVVPNDLFYQSTPMGTYTFNQNYQQMYDNEKSLSVRIVGVFRQKKDVVMSELNAGIAYRDDLAQYVINADKDSAILKAQQNSERNVLTMEPMDADTKMQMISYLGGDETPYVITIYPRSFNAKDDVLKYLDAYNKGKSKEEQVIYTDMADTITSLSGGIIDGITMVLVAFAATSLIVSLIMIAIITYTSVLERTKEIGVLRALGARKKDITRVFDAETCLLGIFSGCLGIGIAYLLTFPINSIIYAATELKNVAQLQPIHALLLIVISTVLTMLGGHIPARMASKKDAVEALRSE